ncbi:hypothetical protein T03_14193 [Trichinella britovi]|uniref:Uncharacterized protein n=1 Tax=Trichinella britovi TaxID=45882 RepID=A0A0V1B2G1_TRIBR|nr:hypothetical protein T03_14193 [Trichinella britovi]
MIHNDDCELQFSCRALFGDWLMTSAISLANYCDK